METEVALPRPRRDRGAAGQRDTDVGPIEIIAIDGTEERREVARVDTGEELREVAPIDQEADFLWTHLAHLADSIEEAVGELVGSFAIQDQL